MEKHKSGIKYTTGDNGSADAIQYANKIVTINDSDYFLLDAHNLDWNKSVLKHINPKDIKYSGCNTRNEAIAEFFEIPEGATDDAINRQRYYANEKPTYKDDGSLDPLPYWYKGNDEQDVVHNSAELLDIIDFLAALSNKALKEIDMLKNQLDKDKAMLVLDPRDIEKMGGTIDDNGDVKSNPIEFMLKPNQTNDLFITSNGTKKFYDKKESRHVILALYVYTVDKVPITDPAVLYDTTKDNYDQTCGLIYTAEPHNIDDTTPPNGSTTDLTVGILSSSQTGLFRIAFDVTGWTVGNNIPNSKPSNIHLTKLENFTNSMSFNSMYDFSKDDECDVTFNCSTKHTENHRASDIRTIIFKLRKAENTFEHVFICGEEYIYISSNFFNGYENDDRFEQYISRPSKQNPAKKIKLCYLIRRSLIPVSLESFGVDTFINNESLLDSLIVANNDYFDETSFNIKGLNTIINREISIEVYPKFYGAKHIWEDIAKNYVLPGAYEKTDNDDGKDHFAPTGSDIKYYNKTALYEKPGLMAPLYCFDTIRSKYQHGDKTFYTLPTNETSNNVNVADQYVTRIIDGVERPGFKFTFTILGNENAIKQHNILVKNDANYILNNVKPVFIDVIFGTTAAKYVASNFLKVRFYLTTSSLVYWIDRTKQFSHSSEFNNHDKLSSQWTLPKNISNNLINYYGLSDDKQKLPHNSLLFTHSEITKNAQDEYVWNLKLPIFSYCSWLVPATGATQNTNASNTSSTYIVNNIWKNFIYPQIRDIKPFGTPPPNELPKPTGPEQLPESFINDNKVIYKDYKYSYGFPSIPIGFMRGNTTQDYTRHSNKLLIEAVCLVENSTQPLDISDEIEIDYAATYDASLEFINNLPTKLKDRITKNATKQDNGKVLCSYYGGLEIRNGIKYLTFIHPTISEKDLAPSLDKNDDFNEWEDTIQNQNDIKNNLTIVLRVPETIIVEQNGATINHTEGKMKLIVNVDRARKEFAGWARRIDVNNNQSVLASTVLCGNQISKSDYIVNTKAFLQDNKHVIQTRNESNITIANGVNKYGVASYNSGKGMYGGEGNLPLEDIHSFLKTTDKCHKFEVTNNYANQYTTTTLYCKQNDNEFTIYRTNNFKPEEVTDADINYVVDIPLTAKLEFLMNGDEWFRGYTPKTDDRLTLDINIYNNKNDGVKFIGRTTTTSNVPYNLGNGNDNWTPQVSQLFGTTDTNMGTLEGGWYLDLYKSFANFEEFKNSLEKWELDLFVDNFDGGNDNGKLLGLSYLINKIYGVDGWKKYVKISITAGFKVNDGKYPTSLANIFNVVPNSDTIKQYIYKDSLTNTWKLTTDYGYNKMYIGVDEKPIDNYFVKDETNGKVVWKLTDAMKEEFEKYKEKSFTFGMNVAVMFPMTHIYRGKYFVFRFHLNVG